jgi:hypothetical protein
MDIAQIIELAWVHAYPGREVAERNSVLRQLWKALQPTSESVQWPWPYLRLVDAVHHRR